VLLAAAALLQPHHSQLPLLLSLPLQHLFLLLEKMM
jgi:hypothetical protein